MGLIITSLKTTNSPTETVKKDLRPPVSKTGDTAKYIISSSSASDVSCTTSTLTNLSPAVFELSVLAEVVEDFSRTFIEVAARGDFQTVELMMKDRLFLYIPMTQRGFGEAFRKAATNGHVEVVKLMMNHKFFKDMPVDYNSSDGLQYAFYYAAINNREEVVEMIAKDSRFGDISVELMYGVGYAFVEAANLGYLGVVQVILKSSCFEELILDDTYGVKQALTKAACRGHLSVVQEILINIGKIRLWQMQDKLLSIQVLTRHAQIKDYIEKVLENMRIYE